MQVKNGRRSLTEGDTSRCPVAFPRPFGSSANILSCDSDVTSSPPVTEHPFAMAASAPDA
eukprot:84191-Hanusia_phi.AAC.1